MGCAHMSSIEYPFRLNFVSGISTNSVFVGIDPSTNILGWSVIDENKKILYAESIKLNTKDDTHEQEILSKMMLLSEEVFPHIASILETIQYKNIQFGIEHFAYAYIGTTQKTIVALSAINYFIQYLIVDRLKHSPQTVYPNTARKQSGVVKEKFDKTDMKELVFYRLMVLYESQLDPSLFDTTKKFRKISGLYDAFDSLIIARSLVAQ